MNVRPKSPLAGADRCPELSLLRTKQADADRLREHLATALAADIAGLADLLATTTDRDLFQ